MAGLETLGEIMLTPSAAAVVTVEVAVTYAALETVTVDGPGSKPFSSAFAVWPPAGIVTVGVDTPTRVGTLEVTVKVTPPAGAGAGI